MRLAKWRKEKGLTQEQVADMLGCTQPYVSSIERAVDPQDCSVEIMRRIYRVTFGDVTPNDLVFPSGLPDLDQPRLPLADQPAPLFDRQADAGACATPESVPAELDRAA